jgi:hypothetical protein
LRQHLGADAPCVLASSVAQVHGRISSNDQQAFAHTAQRVALIGERQM